MTFVSRCFEAAALAGKTCVNADSGCCGAIPEAEELIQELSAAGVLAEAEEKGKTMLVAARDVFAGNSAADDCSVAGACSAEGRSLLAGLIDLIA